MTKYKLLIALIVTVTTCCHRLQAQTSGNNSPYSRYGIGTLADEAQGFNKGMAGVGLGMSGPNLLNHQNPASYAAIDSLTMIFDIGASFNTAHMTYNGSSVNPQNTTLDYVQAGFRLFKGLGLSLGMRPFSVVGYNFNSSRTMEDIDGYGEKTNTATYLGEGGLHLAYIGLGWAPVKNFAIGANVSYLWGDYSHASNISFSESNMQSLYRSYTGNINTWLLDWGLQYTYPINKDNQITAGVTLGIGHQIDQQAVFINQKRTTSSVVGADTTNIGKAYEIPWSYGIGAAWNHKDRWVIGIDYTCQMWQDCRFPRLEDEGGSQVYKVGTNSFSNRHKVTIGGQYTPNPQGYRMRDHINYRFGVSYATPYFKMYNQDGPKNYLASLGVSIPITNRYNNSSSINISTQYEHVSPSNDNLIKEDYFRLCVGLTFNATWFNKWKFE